MLARSLAPALTALALGAFTPAALADEPQRCSAGFQSYPTEQLAAHVATLRDASADEFLKALAYEDLICSDRDAVRKMALEAALAAEAGAGLNAQALLDLMMDRSTLVVQLEPGEGMKAETYTWIEGFGGALAFDLRNHERATATISTSGYRRNGKIDLSGGVVSLNHDAFRAALELDGAGALRGFVYHDDIEEPAPAVVRLY